MLSVGFAKTPPLCGSLLDIKRARSLTLRDGRVKRTAATAGRGVGMGEHVHDTKLRLLAVSGSLRSASSNTALLRAAASLAPENVEVHLYEGLAELPHFNPDL